MPHILVKLWPGKTEAQTQELADRITREVTEVLASGDDSVSVAMEEVNAQDWAEKVYRPEIMGHPEQLYKKPGYRMECDPAGATVSRTSPHAIATAIVQWRCVRQAGRLRPDGLLKRITSA